MADTERTAGTTGTALEKPASHDCRSADDSLRGREGHLAHQRAPHGPEKNSGLLRRLARIEGQVRGIRRLVEEDAYCVDVLVQISAARAALQAVGLSILDRHVRTCVSSAIRAEQADEAIKELIDVVKRFTK